MTQRRWQPPPLNDAPAAGAPPKVRVDEEVVRKMLQVNPELRRGRTTQQVKRLLEQGGSVLAGGAGLPGRDGASAGSATRAEGGPGAVVAGQAPAGRAGGSAASASTQLDDTIGFFLRGKAAELETALGALLARRRALDDEEKALKAHAREQMVGFVSLLDRAAVEAHGSRALASHGELLRLVGVGPAELLEAVRRGRR